MSSVINGENSWTSAAKAIWYNSEKKIWLIGSKEKIGGEIAGVYARRVPGKGPEDDKNVWNYRHFFFNSKNLIVQCAERILNETTIPSNKAYTG